MRGGNALGFESSTFRGDVILNGMANVNDIVRALVREVIETYDPTGGGFNPYASEMELDVAMIDGNTVRAVIEYGYDGDEVSIDRVRNAETGEVIPPEALAAEEDELQMIVWEKRKEDDEVEAAADRADSLDW